MLAGREISYPNYIDELTVSTPVAYI